MRAAIPNDSEIEFELSLDGKFFLLGARQQSKKLYDINGKLLNSDFNNSPDIIQATFSSDAKNILSTSKKGLIKLWTAKGKKIELICERQNITFAKFSPDSTLILVASYSSGIGIIEILDVNRNPICDFKCPNTIFDSSHFSKSGKFLVATTANSKAFVWSLDSETIQTNIFQDVEGIRTAEFITSNNQPFLITTHDSCEVKMWELKTPNPIAIYQHDAGVNFTIMLPDGERLLTWPYVGAPIVWNRESSKLFSINLNINVLSDATISPDGKRILTVSQNEPAQLWNFNGKLLADFSGDGDQIDYAKFLPNDGSKVLTVTRTGSVKIWHTAESVLNYLKNSRVFDFSY